LQELAALRQPAISRHLQTAGARLRNRRRGKAEWVLVFGLLAQRQKGEVRGRVIGMGGDFKDNPLL